jgi:hypothetical protein
MGIDERLLTTAREAATRITTAQRQVDDARAAFQRSIRALYLDGGSLREIAEGLGLSHQRVHQLLDLPATPQRDGRAGTRRRRGSGAALSCSFCGISQSHTLKLIMGPGGVGVCDQCVGLGRSTLTSGEPAWSASVTLALQPAPGQCSFCGKHTGVELPSDPRTPLRLAVAPGTTSTAAICEECLDLCEEIIAELPSPDGTDGPDSTDGPDGTDETGGDRRDGTTRPG